MPPHSKEALYFRKRFEHYFGTGQETANFCPYFWLPNQDWTGCVTEASARALDVYKK